MTIDVNLPKNRQGRYYHLNCGPGDLAPYLLTCGDPDRARRIAKSFDRVEVKRRNREFLTYTGSYHGIPVSVIATGIGAAASAIAVVEAAQCVAPATFIRLGSTGALQDYINLGDLIITTEALREENTTYCYAPAEQKALAHPQVLAALKEAAAALRMPHHVGVTCTSPDFYAGQGRIVPGFPTLDPDKVERLSRAGVLNLEMEMSAYLTLAAVSTLKLRAGGACAVFLNRLNHTFVSARLMRQSEKRLIEVGLRAVEILAAQDRG
ncbi:MAG: nucleoside phosphorylase [Deltaproteobacteria bacterium]|nr:nucleoside phosphorylase [Deltaproteobacteria bacterium]